MRKTFTDTFRSASSAVKGGSKQTKEWETRNIDLEPDAPESKIPVVTAKAQPRRHKVIQFGYTVTVEGEVPDSYRFQYPANPDNPEELYPGVIPAGYTALVEVEDALLYLHTRQGSLAPEYQVCFAVADNPVADWSDSIDALWMETLSVLEEYQQLAEDALDFLDADPLFLFGLADPSTQKALEKSTTVPMLKCMGQRPVLGEWFSYLNADPHVDGRFQWVVESFADVELPSPWTSYKGVGSIVCYMNNDTTETTWKHPFYEYFAQLLDHCRKATTEEHIKLRVNRMLWTYEADCAMDIAAQQPLLSPKYIQTMADILEVDLLTEPYMVNTLKTFLKAFSQQYRLEEDIDIQEIKWCREIVDNERHKARIADSIDLTVVEADDETANTIDPQVHAQIYCVDCGVLATLYCASCRDCLCEECYHRLHQKGQRKNHVFNMLLPCNICQVYPAKLQCTYTFGNFCHECYARKHVRTLPKFLDLKPLKIDYRLTVNQQGVPAATKGAKPIVPNQVPEKHGHLGQHWHQFYDVRGAPYFFNFTTHESMRRESEQVAEFDPNTHQKLVNLSQDHNPRSLKLFATPLRELEKKTLSPKKETGRPGSTVDPFSTPPKSSSPWMNTPSTAAPTSPVKFNSP